MLRAIGRVGLILTALVAPLGPRRYGPAVPGRRLTLQGDIVAGFRFLPSEPSKSEHAKFEEYRDIQQSFSSARSGSGSIPPTRRPSSSSEDAPGG